MNISGSTFAPLYGLVLGGGHSRRMGVDKAAIAYRGQSQIAVAMDLLEGLCSRKFVGIRPDQVHDPIFAGFPPLIDRYPGEGPLGAIVSAQEQYPEAAWLVLACDLPFLDRPTLAYLVVNRGDAHQAVVYLSAHDGRAEPLCAVYEPRSAGGLSAAFQAGLRCARKGVESLHPYALNLPNHLALDNANTPADKEMAMKQLSPGTKPL